MKVKKPPPCVGTDMPVEGTFSQLRGSFNERYFFDTLQRGRDDAISSSHIVRIRMS